MPVSAETLRLLVDAGLTGDQIVAVAESIEADASRAPRSPAAKRQARYRERGGGSVPEDVRQAIFERDTHQCQDCGSTEHLAIDHIIPVSKGGTSEVDNLQTLCRVCNSRKRDRIRKRDVRRLSAGQSAELSAEKENTPTPPKEKTLPKKTPKGVQKGVPAGLDERDRQEIEAALDRMAGYLPPNARRKGREANRFAMQRAVLRGASVADLEAACKRWCDESDGKTETFLAFCDRDLWREWVPDKPAGTDWAGELRLFGLDGTWRPPGPEPGQPGCQAPPEILAEFGYRKDAA